MTDAASISAFKQAEVQQQVIYAVARKSLDHAKAQGDAALTLLQGAAELAQNAAGAKAGPQPLAQGQSINFLA